MYLSGLGELYEGDRYSDGNSSGDFYFRGEVAVGNTSTAINWFKKLQQVINRFSKVANFSQMTVDGELGSKTTARLKKAVAYSQATVSGTSNTYALRIATGASTAKDYAYLADDLSGILESIAGSLSLSTIGPSPKPSTPGDSPSTIADKTAAAAPKKPGLMDMQIAGLPAIAVAGGAALFLWYRSKGKGKKASPRRRKGKR